MRTEEVIRALAIDAARPVHPIGRVLWRATGLGAILSLAAFGAILRPRIDLGAALRTIPFDFKLAVFALLAAAAAPLLIEAARPQPPRRWQRLLLVPTLLVAAVAAELASVPAAAWGTRLIGHNAAHCVTLVPVLSLPPAVCLLLALRRGAPGSPLLAGAVAGLVAGGLGALLYALSCPDDSPLFIATWYSTAIAVVCGATACLGSRWLRW
jgi:hypothetical protein